MAVNSGRRTVKYLEDTNLEILSKNGKKQIRPIPPKLRGKHYTNMEYLANADLIWLIPNLNVSPIYDEANDTSYFEQCFRPCEKLGEGSFAFAIKVKSLDDNQMYAMKVSKEPFKNEFDRKQKIKEVKHHQSLSSHPNIVTLHNAWEEDRYVFMQLELCKPVIEEGVQMSEENCWIVLTDILLALDYIHETNRGHFDVKLENILKGDDNVYKLCDFGLMLNLGQDKEVLKEGDAKYVAPELIMGGVKEFTAKADIFSLGISILELAGNLELPNSGEVWSALRENVFPLKQTQHVSDELFDVIVRMMAPDPEQRPSAQELLALPKIKEQVNQRAETIDWKNVDSNLQSNESEFTFGNCSSGISSPSNLSFEAVSNRQGSLFSSTPLCTAEEVFTLSGAVVTKKVDFLMKGRDSMNSGLEDSGCASLEIPPSAPQLSPEHPRCTSRRGFRPSPRYSPLGSAESPIRPVSPPPAQIVCDWIGITSPNKSIRDASLRNRNRIHCPSESLLGYGISPIRLSKSVKREYKAKKRFGMMRPRNLAQSFDEEDSSN